MDEDKSSSSSSSSESEDEEDRRGQKKSRQPQSVIRIKQVLNSEAAFALLTPADPGSILRVHKYY